MTRIKPLSDDDAAKLLEPLGLMVNAARAKALSDAITNAVCELETALLKDPGIMDERRAELECIATDPAGTLEDEPMSRAGSLVRSGLVYLGVFKGIDAETRKGAVQIRDLARARLARNLPGKKPQRIKNAEVQMLTGVWHFLTQIAPDAPPLPGKADCDEDHPVLNFAEDFIFDVVSRARLMVPPEDTATHGELDKIQGRKRRTIRDHLVGIKSATSPQKKRRRISNKT
ncbi:hypothetical protein [Roseinatronobacter alkalisoli]|uniref:Uncharacterized protein n=1 Tax=Roseinatronobacter alkalisoli TaxID=3028235 RepID=A0ABT5TGZ4_9RHOB|nr:hypothetical protein [Roseinatronobacter sp. HJB301]MDD7973203.1 hypothetical protein [Roseinatronobacter sp. HJB301]